MAYSEEVLTLQQPEPKRNLLPVNPSCNFLENLSAHLTFVKDEMGKVNKANFYESGQTVEALRMEDKVEVQVDPANYEALVGKDGS